MTWDCWFAQLLINDGYLNAPAAHFSGVINLKCPKDPGWWYWKGNCYYIETTKHLTWEEAKNFCTSYHETELMALPQTKEEKVACINWYNRRPFIDSVKYTNSHLRKLTYLQRHVWWMSVCNLRGDFGMLGILTWSKIVIAVKFQTFVTSFPT